MLISGAMTLHINFEKKYQHRVVWRVVCIFKWHAVFRKLTIKELIYMYSQAIVCQQYLCLLFIAATCCSSLWTVVRELYSSVKYIHMHYSVSRNLHNRNVNHQAGEHISIYSTECYICHLNFLTTARQNDREMLCIKKKNSNSMLLFYFHLVLALMHV
jgi:hypothetical protein